MDRIRVEEVHTHRGNFQVSAVARRNPPGLDWSGVWYVLDYDESEPEKLWDEPRHLGQLAKRSRSPEEAIVLSLEEGKRWIDQFLDG
jgi:hypothetical protein